MNREASFEKIPTIVRMGHPVPASDLWRRPAYPAITICAQAGARGETIARRLQERLARDDRDVGDGPQWSLVEAELVRLALREDNLPEELAKYFPEDARSVWTDTIEELVGLHPSSYTVRERCRRLIPRLCAAGRVIVVGWCGNLAARGMPNVLHARLVGSLERRAARIAAELRLDEKPALKRLWAEDAARRRFARENFDQSRPEDPALYDLVINTDALSDDSVVSLIQEALWTKVPDAGGAGVERR